MGCNCTESRIDINCGCGTKPTCAPKDCSCPVRISSDCWHYSGDDLECSGIKKGTIGTELIEQLDAFICAKFNDVQNFFSLVNTGLGARIYNGVDLQGRRQIRSITKTGDLIVVTENPDDVAITIDEIALAALITGSVSSNTYDVSNVVGGARLFKDNTVVANNTTFNFRSLKSSTLNIVEEVDDTISIEVVDTSGGVRDFIVNTRYLGAEELGTVAKPFKTLDAAIVAYIGTGTRANPEFVSSRIFCTGGQYHEFTENLSINSLILEVEVGTTIKYMGTDLYPIDFRPLQTALGGYGNQTSGIAIVIRGGGTIISNNLFAYAVNSGHTLSNPSRFYNVLAINDITIVSEYRIGDFEAGITRSNGSPWVSNNSTQTLFYFGTVTQAVIVATGQSLINNLDDNLYAGLVFINNASILSLTQQVIENNSAFVQLVDSEITNNNQRNGISYIIADMDARVGNVLTEAPLLSHTLGKFKDDLCLIETNGLGSTSIEGGRLSTGFEITFSEAVYKMNSSSSYLSIKNSETSEVSGGILAHSFIKTGIYEADIRINDTSVLKPISNLANFINSSVDPYDKVNIKNNVFEFGVSDNIDLTAANSRSAINIFNGKIKESLQKFQSRAQAVSNGLTSGDIFVLRKGVGADDLIAGEEYVVLVPGSPSLGTEGSYFVATGAETGTGTAYFYRRDIIL